MKLQVDNISIRAMQKCVASGSHSSENSLCVCLQDLTNFLKHYILTSGHPSPLSANRGYWFGNKHFSETNTYLRKIGKQEIKW